MLATALMVSVYYLHSTSFPGFPRINYYVTMHTVYTSKYNVYLEDLFVYVDSRGFNRAGPNASRAGLWPKFLTGQARPGAGRAGPNDFLIR